MERNWENRLKKFDRVWERVRDAAPQPPPPGHRPPAPPPPPPKKKCCGRGTRFCPRGFRG